MKLLPSCRDVRDRLTDLQEGALPLGERLALRFHLLLCGACAEFRRGLRALPGVARDLLGSEAPAPPAAPEARRALEAALRDAGGRSGKP